MGDVTPLTEERLTWPEICDRYPMQWVVLVGTAWVDKWHAWVDTAIVAGHGEHDEAWAQSEPFRTRYPEAVQTHTRPVLPPWVRDPDVAVCELPP
jgi:hypothetical protein